MISRTAVGAALLGLGGGIAPLRAADSGPRYRIGACDWSIGGMSQVEALSVAAEIGLDGVQVSLGTEANDMQLRRPEVQREYLAAAARTGVKIASLAIGELNNIPYKSDPRTIEWVRGSIDAARALGCRVVLLAFFGKGDLRDDAAGIREVIRRLKAVAPHAEKQGIVLGVESWLNAEDHMRIIDAVGSPAVQVYYDVANMTTRGYDIFKELRWLGKKRRICEIHLKENGHLLGQGEVDFRKVREVVEAIEFRDWLIIEGAVPEGQPMRESYVANRKFVRELFG